MREKILSEEMYSSINDFMNKRMDDYLEEDTRPAYTMEIDMRNHIKNNKKRKENNSPWYRQFEGKKKKH